MSRNGTRRQARSTGVAILAFLLIFALPGVQAGSDYEPVVTELLGLMESRPDLQESVEAAIDIADLKDVRDMDEFVAYLDQLVTFVPTEREVVPECLKFYYIINQAPGNALNDDEQFNAWMKDLVRAWGTFLDTPASAAGIATFRGATNYNIDDYIEGPSGWQTFNQFFAREVKSGRRPVAEPRNDRIIVSPADAVFMGQWPIDENSNITVKGVNWAIADLLGDSPYRDAFKGGIYTHSFLYIDDYHRYHVPVAGTVKEVRNISGKVYMDVFREDDGTLNVVDGDTYQFNQERGLVVIDSPEVGLVAVLPIGMAYVSSVNLTTEIGAELRKGDQFGYFMFGGSDIVTVFQDRNVVLDAEVGKKYLQGQRLGELETLP
ncbi:MAG: phophatidylserine decarboxylase associated domain-containing protein [Woeseiaceae bacterium]|nr:phophatidylserine decarboxylase associated domain-containing protein [Woeseiaceae bacterium]